MNSKGSRTKPLLLVPCSSLLSYQQRGYSGNHGQLLLQSQQMENKNATLFLCEYETSHYCLMRKGGKM